MLFSNLNALLFYLIYMTNLYSHVAHEYVHHLSNVVLWCYQHELFQYLFVCVLLFVIFMSSEGLWPPAHSRFLTKVKMS